LNAGGNQGDIVLGEVKATGGVQTAAAVLAESDALRLKWGF